MKEALKINHGNDEFYTPTYAIVPLIKYIPRDVHTIWCPCDTETSKIAQFLSAVGFEVHTSHLESGCDFLNFELPYHYDMIITNPPFSIKDKIIKRCYESKKPFALLLPLTALEGIARGNMYRENGMGVVIFDKRVEYGAGSVWFNTSWFIHTPLTDGRLFFEKITPVDENK